ncbi:25353_t:CDS:2, partial [Racocetra persica]
MISSYKTLNPTYVIPTYSTDEISKFSNLHGQTEESYASETDFTSTMVLDAYDPQLNIHNNTYHPVDSPFNVYENVDHYQS